MDRETLKAMNLTDEQIDTIMSDYGKAISKEKAKQETLKSDSIKLAELTKQLEAMKKAETEKDKVVEGKDKDIEAMQTQLADLQAQIKAKELKANLAEQGIVGENADKIIDGLTNGNFDVSVLGLIIADREKSAVDAKVKELTEGATNPNGGKAGASVEKTDAEKMAENIGDSLAQGNKASADVLAQYI